MKKWDIYYTSSFALAKQKLNEFEMNGFTIFSVNTVSINGYDSIYYVITYYK